MAITEFEVTGWVEKPTYDASTHRLVWSASLRDKGTAAGAGQALITILTCSAGYLTSNLVTDMAHVEEEKPLAHALLAAVAFNDGKRYQDFNPQVQTKVAEYGLAAVGGIAAKKLGLLTMAGVFLAKAWKLVMLGIFALAPGSKVFSKNAPESFWRKPI